MGKVTHEQANLMLRLYELRREPRLRQAREWFIREFHANTPEEGQKLTPPGSEAHTSFRMVTSYWEMVAGIVNRGLVDEEFFFEQGAEQYLVWNRLRPLAPAVRQMFKNPHAWEHLEKHCKHLEAWWNKRSPGALEFALERAKLKNA